MLNWHTSAGRTAFVAAASTIACAFVSADALAARRSGGTPPVISGTPPTLVSEGASYSFRPTAYDADRDSLKFTVQGKPGWATFDRRSGSLAGTPAIGTAGTYANIVISVTDGKSIVSLPGFAITVSPVAARANSAPTISGVPVTVAEVDRPYSFRPTASDPNGDRLTFAIEGKPSWATFEASTGALYGAPTSANVGKSGNIVISVNDGKATSTLTGFTITVAPALVSSVTISWTRPTQNSDGTPLTDLAGYKIFYGDASRQYAYNISIVGGTVTSAVIEGLASGTTWHFAVKSVTSAGTESDYSGEATRTL